MKKEDQRIIEIENLLMNKKDISQDTIDEILSLSKNPERQEQQQEKEDTLSQIKMKMLDEEDWRKKAALAAMYISKSLE